MITQITYARLYNLGNYENERLEAVASVENGDVGAAFAEAKAACDAHKALLERLRAAERQRQEEEWKAERERIAAERAAQRAAVPTVAGGHEDDDPDDPDNDF